MLVLLPPVPQYIFVRGFRPPDALAFPRRPPNLRHQSDSLTGWMSYHRLTGCVPPASSWRLLEGVWLHWLAALIHWLHCIVLWYSLLMLAAHYVRSSHSSFVLWLLGWERADSALFLLACSTLFIPCSLSLSLSLSLLLYSTLRVCSLLLTLRYPLVLAIAHIARH